MLHIIFSMQILLAGGAGFVGSHIADKLIEKGHEVLVVDNLEKGSIENIQHNIGKSGFKFIKSDIRDIFELEEKPDVIVNLIASKIPRYSSGFNTLTLNVEVARHLLDLTKKYNSRHVLISTSDVYGKSTDFPLREDGDLVLGPSTSRRWAYAVSKIYNEHLALSYMDEFNVYVTILRYFGIYGPRQHLNWWGGPVGVFIDAIYNDREVEIHGSGKQKRSFIYIDDVVEATLKVIESTSLNGEIINIGTEEEISILELAKKIALLMDKQPAFKFVPYESFTKNYEDPMRRVGDITKAKKMLGFEPKINLEEGLKKTIKWYRALKKE